MQDLPILNWNPRFDPESKNYPVRAVLRSTVRRRDKMWRIGPILDQGREGACVGFGWTAEALSTPIPVRLKFMAHKVPHEPNEFASFIYNEAKKIDEWEGVEYEGTSVLAGAKAMKNVGLVREYRWAFSLEDVIDTVLSKGPVVVGTYWYENMYDPQGGILKPSGRVVGGHCYAVVGYRVKPAELGGTEDALVIQNSWGPLWGRNGTALLSLTDAAYLLEYGEAAVVTRRSYGWTIFPPQKVAKIA